MAKIDHKIAASGFTVASGITFEELRALASDAAHRTSGVVTKAVETGVTQDVGIAYAVKRAGMLSLLDFMLTFKPGDSSNTVSLRPGSYLTSQMKPFFIPISPKSAAGYPVLKKFSEIVRAGLVAHG